MSSSTPIIQDPLQRVKTMMKQCEYYMLRVWQESAAKIPDDIHRYVWMLYDYDSLTEDREKSLRARGLGAKIDGQRSLARKFGVIATCPSLMHEDFVRGTLLHLNQGADMYAEFRTLSSHSELFRWVAIMGDDVWTGTTAIVNHLNN